MKNMIRFDVAFCNFKLLNSSFVRSGYVKDFNNQPPYYQLTGLLIIIIIVFPCGDVSCGGVQLNAPTVIITW